MFMFGTFSTASGQAKRHRLWSEVPAIAQELGLAKPEATVKQLRHGLYANQTRATRDKRDRLRRTGEGGDDGLDELDHIVLDIVGNDADETQTSVPGAFSSLTVPTMDALIPEVTEILFEPVTQDDSTPSPAPPTPPVPEAAHAPMAGSSLPSPGLADHITRRAENRARHEAVMALPPAERSVDEWRYVHMVSVCQITEAIARRLRGGENVPMTDLALAAMASTILPK